MKLDDNYEIIPDSTHGWKLVFTEERENKNGVLKVYEDIFYYPSMSFCLKKYLDLSLRSCESIKEVLNRIEEVESKIMSL